ncbi:MAG: hypothetical protein WBD62_06745 [Anaerolineales bacterium]
MSEEKKASIRPPSYLNALIPIIVLIVLLASAVYLYGADGTTGPIHVALMLSMMVAGLIGLKNGHIKPEEEIKEPPDKTASCYIIQSLIFQ